MDSTGDRGVWLTLDQVRLALVAMIKWLKEHAPEEGLQYHTTDGDKEDA